MGLCHFPRKDWKSNQSKTWKIELKGSVLTDSGGGRRKLQRQQQKSSSLLSSKWRRCGGSGYQDY